MITAIAGADAQSAPAVAVSDMLTSVSDINSLTGSAWRSMYTSAPATMAWRDSVSVSSAHASYDRQTLSTPVVVQEGSGHDLYSLTMESYYKFSPLTTLWGHASFTAGSTRDVRFANCIDYSLVAPYSLGDEVGGDLRHQRYMFGGGWNHRYGQWTVGAEANYRAEIAHRSHDPRVRDVVSDLDFTVGGSRRVLSRYAAAVNVGARIYHQDSDIDYYNPANTTKTRLLTGLGSTYSRFDNNQTNSVGHDLTALTASLQFLPAAVDTAGTAVSISYTMASAGLKMRNYNNLTLGTTKTNTLSATVAQHIKAARVTVQPTLSATMVSRSSTENIFGTPQGGSYDKIGSRPNYSLDVMSATVSIPVRWNPRADWWFSARPQATWHSSTEKLSQPARRLNIDNLTAGIDLEATRRIGRLTALTLGADAAVTADMSSSASWGDLDTKSSLGQATVSNYDMASSSRRLIGGHLAVDRTFGRRVGRLSIDYHNIKYSHYSSGYALTASLSFIF